MVRSPMAHFRIPLLAPALVLTAIAVVITAHGQSPINSDTVPMVDSVRHSEPPNARAWYDSLSITQPQYAVVSHDNLLSLGLFTTVTLPLQLLVVMGTFAPPSLAILADEGVDRGGVAVSTGFGIGRRLSQDEVFWPEVRLQWERVHYFARSTQDMWRATLARDWPVVAIDDRGILHLGGSVGIGVTEDAGSYQPHVQVMASVMNPMGISYLTLFPMHVWGARGRVGWNPESREYWFELTIGGEAAFWF